MSWSAVCNATWASTLHKLINDEGDDEWKSVIERVRAHPNEAAILGQAHRMTPLHCACLRYPPNDAIKALVEACPQSAASQNKEGETPLHLAAEGASEQVQLTLLKACPKALITQDKYGDTPCHRAVTLGSSTEVLEHFVMVHPDVIDIENNQGITSFMILPKGYEDAQSLSDIDEDGEFWDDWESAMIFLKASYSRCRTKSKDGKFMVVQAVAATRCPRALLKACIRLFPSQLLSMDSKGRVPLSIASRSLRFNEPQINIDGTRETPKEKSGRELNETVVQIILRAETKAASIADNDGRYPLIHAIENGIDWHEGLQDILNAYPQCLDEKEPVSNLYPFMLAGASKGASITTIFSLLRANPVTVKCGIPQVEKRQVIKTDKYVENMMQTKHVICDVLSRRKKLRLA